MQALSSLSPLQRPLYGQGQALTPAVAADITRWREHARSLLLAITKAARRWILKAVFAAWVGGWWRPQQALTGCSEWGHEKHVNDAAQGAYARPSSWPWMLSIMLRAWAAVSWRPTARKAHGIRAAETDIALFIFKRNCTWESAMFSAWRCQASLEAKCCMRKVSAQENRNTLLFARVTQICFTSWHYGTASFPRQRSEVDNHRSEIGVQVATATTSKQQMQVDRICELESQVRRLLERLQQSEQRVNESEAQNESNKRRAGEAEQKIKLIESSVAPKSQRACDRIAELHMIALARWCLGTWRCVASTFIALRAQQNTMNCNAIALEEANAALEVADVNQREVARLAEVRAWERAVASIAEAECSMQDSLGGTFDTDNQILHQHLNREAEEFAADEMSSSREAVREALVAAEDARKCREELHAMHNAANTQAALFEQYQNQCAEQEAMLMVNTQACREAYMTQNMHEAYEAQSCRVAMQMLQSELQECKVRANQDALSLDEALSAHMACEHEVQSSRHAAQQLWRELQWSEDRVNELATAMQIAEADAGQADLEIDLLRNSIAQLQGDMRKVEGDSTRHSQSQLGDERRQNTETLRRRARQWIRRISATLETGQKYKLMQSCFMAWCSDYILEMRSKHESGIASKPTLGTLQEENQRLRQQRLVHLHAVAGYSSRSREELFTKSFKAALAMWRMHADLSIAAKRCVAAREIAEAWEYEQQDCISATAEVVAISERLALVEASQRSELELEVARDLQNEEIEAAISDHLTSVEASISERLVHAESSHRNELQAAKSQSCHRQRLQSRRVIFANINRMSSCSERMFLKMVANLWRSACQSEMSTMARKHWAHGNGDDFVSLSFSMLDTEPQRETAYLDSPTPSVSNLPPIDAQFPDTSFARDGLLQALDELPEISLSLSEETTSLSPQRGAVGNAIANKATSPMPCRRGDHSEVIALDSLAVQMRHLASWAADGEAFRARVAFAAWQQFGKEVHWRIAAAAARAACINRLLLAVLKAVLIAWLHVSISMTKYLPMQILAQSRLAPGMLAAMLAVWRQRARTIGLMTWHWRCYRLALLRATVDAWHLVAIDLRSYQASEISVSSSGVTQPVPSMAPSSRRGPAIRHASRTRAAIPQQTVTLSATARRRIGSTDRGRSSAHEDELHRSHSPKRCNAKIPARRSSSAEPKFSSHPCLRKAIDEEAPLISHISLVDLQPRMTPRVAYRSELI